MRVYRAFSVSGVLVGVWWVFGGSLVGLWWVFGGSLVGRFGGSLVGLWWGTKGPPKTHQNSNTGKIKKICIFGRFLVGLWWVFGGSLVGVWWVALVGLWWVFGGGPKTHQRPTKDRVESACGGGSFSHRRISAPLRKVGSVGKEVSVGK